MVLQTERNSASHRRSMARAAQAGGLYHQHVGSASESGRDREQQLGNIGSYNARLCFPSMHARLIMHSAR